MALSREVKAKRKAVTDYYLATDKQRRIHRLKSKLAVQLVGEEIRAGRLVRLPCVVCGEAKSQGHHEDYDKPLEVVWLCGEHHASRHKEINKIRGSNVTKYTEAYKQRLQAEQMLA
jgi:hypothetical protein